MQSFPTPGAKVQISNTGADWPVWSRDGKELFFISVTDQKMMAVPVNGAALNDMSVFEAGTPPGLFDTSNSPFDVGKDSRFLILQPVAQRPGGRLNIVANWAAGLKK